LIANCGVCGKKAKIWTTLDDYDKNGKHTLSTLVCKDCTLEAL